MADLGQEPASLNLRCRSGDRFRFTITMEDENGDPVDWSGYDFTAQVRRNPYDTSSPLATFGIDEAQAGTGILVLTLSATDTATLLPAASQKAVDSFVWDLQRVKTSDTTDRLTTHAGTLTITMDVTRP